MDGAARRKSCAVQSGAFQLSAGALPLTKVKGLGWLTTENLSEMGFTMILLAESGIELEFTVLHWFKDVSGKLSTGLPRNL